MVFTHRTWWGLALSASLLGGALVFGAVSCSTDDSTTPSGSGNTVYTLDATTQPGQPQTSDAADSPFAPVEGSVYGTPDGYDPYGTCLKCGCPKGTYCFGGGTGYTSFSGNCMPDAFAIGCQPIPSACESDASCECLIQATAAEVPCYPECVQNTRILYCQHP